MAGDAHGNSVGVAAAPEQVPCGVRISTKGAVGGRSSLEPECKLAVPQEAPPCCKGQATLFIGDIGGGPEVSTTGLIKGRKSLVPGLSIYSLAREGTCRPEGEEHLLGSRVQV